MPPESISRYREVLASKKFEIPQYLTLHEYTDFWIRLYQNKLEAVAISKILPPPQFLPLPELSQTPDSKEKKSRSKSRRRHSKHSKNKDKDDEMEIEVSELVPTPNEISQQNFNETGYWFYLLFSRFSEVKASNADILSRLRQSKFENKISEFTIWEGLNCFLCTILTASMYLVPEFGQLLGEKMQASSETLQKHVKTMSELHMFLEYIFKKVQEELLAGSNVNSDLEFCLQNMSYFYITDEMVKQVKDKKELHIKKVKDVFEHQKFRKKLADQPQLFTREINDTGEFCYMYQRFFRLAAKGEKAFIHAMNLLSRNLGNILVYFSFNRKRGVKSMLATLRICRSFLEKNIFPNQDKANIAMLNAWMKALIVFRNQYNPCGSRAYSLLQQTYLESTFPGVNRLKWLRKQFPYLDYYNPILELTDDCHLKEHNVIELTAYFYSDCSQAAYLLICEHLKYMRRQKSHADEERIQNYKGTIKGLRRFLLWEQLS